MSTIMWQHKKAVSGARHMYGRPNVMSSISCNHMKALSGNRHICIKPNIMLIAICVHVPSSAPKVTAIMVLQMAQEHVIIVNVGYMYISENIDGDDRMCNINDQLPQLLVAFIRIGKDIFSIEQC